MADLTIQICGTNLDLQNGMKTRLSNGILTLFFLFSFLSSARADQGPVITITAVGDIMMGSTYPVSNLPEANGSELFRESERIFRSSDLAFGNLEGPLLDNGNPRKLARAGRSYVFRTPSRFVENLFSAGFNIMSLMNNHAQDFGREGLQSTKEALLNKQIKFSSSIDDPAMLIVKGLKIAVVAVMWTPSGKSIIEPSYIYQTIRRLNATHDLVFVSVHAGAEGRGALQTRDQTEIFMGENRGNIVKFARGAIDAGADLVLGHGPHVPRALEIHKGKLIAYSLGNFCTFGGMNLDGESGLAPLLEAKLDREGFFLEGRIHSFIQRRPGGPRNDPSARVADLMKSLSARDFPDSQPIFSTDGRFYPNFNKSAPAQITRSLY